MGRFIEAKRGSDPPLGKDTNTTSGKFTKAVGVFLREYVYPDLPLLASLKGQCPFFIVKFIFFEVRYIDDNGTN